MSGNPDFADAESGDSFNSSSSTQHAWWIPNKRCGHEIAAHVYTSYSVKNPGRRFYRCRYHREDDCKYFEWYDPETPQPYKSAMINMITKSKYLEVQLNEKIELERRSNEKAESAMRASRTTQTHLRQYTQTVAQMKREMNELLVENNHLKGMIKKFQVLCWIVMMCVVIVLAICFKYDIGKGNGKFKSIA